MKMVKVKIFDKKSKKLYAEIMFNNNDDAELWSMYFVKSSLVSTSIEIFNLVNLIRFQTKEEEQKKLEDFLKYFTLEIDDISWKVESSNTISDLFS